MLATFEEEKLSMFENDFMCIINICRQLNSRIWRVERGVEHNLALLDEYVQQFSDKYQPLQIRLETTRFYEERPVILLRDEENGLHHVFYIAGKIIPGIRGITIETKSERVELSPEKFEQDFDVYKPMLFDSNIYIDIMGHNKEPRNLHLRYREDVDMIELVLDNLDFTAKDPEFQLCAYYGLSFGYRDTQLDDIRHRFIGPVSGYETVFRGYAGGERYG